MTIHKAQGQTFDMVGLDLPQGVFGHGQLYVALSRCRHSEGLRVRIRHPIPGIHEIVQEGERRGDGPTRNRVFYDIIW